MKKNQQTEILIAVVLAIVLLCYFGVVYLIRPINEKIDQVNQNITIEEAQVKNTYATITEYGPRKERLEQLATALSKYSGAFYSTEKEDAYLERLSMSVKSCSVDFTSLTAFESQFKMASVYANSDAADRIYSMISADANLKKSDLSKKTKFNTYFSEMKASGGRMENEVVTTTMTIEASGEYNDILAFLKSLMSDGKNIICNNLTLDIAENTSLSAPASPQTRLVATLIFVTIPDIGSLCTVPEFGQLPYYVFPQDILDGSYRNS